MNNQRNQQEQNQENNEAATQQLEQQQRQQSPSQVRTRSCRHLALSLMLQETLPHGISTSPVLQSACTALLVS